MPLQRRILILAEGKFGPVTSKTANGAIAFLQEQVVAVIDSTKAGRTAEDVLGYGGKIPVVSDMDEGMKHQPDTLLIGIAPPGGRLPASWRRYVTDALHRKLHILAGLHTFLSNDAEFASLASKNGCTILDLRKVQEGSKTVSRGSWRKRRGRVILTVGTDCKIGKMTTLLAIHKELGDRGLKTDFVGSGQTGILIAGRGVSVDAVIGDYIAGSIEKEIEVSDAAGNDYILVEGQGALTHQGYSSVTLGLMHGCMPDAMIMCHQPTRVTDDYGFELPDLRRLVRLHEELVGFFRPSKVVGVGLSSIGMTDEESRAAASRIEEETGIPAVDAFRFGGAKLVDALVEYLASAPRPEFPEPIRFPGGTLTL
jgi:uncharacterized NAD-dependent epimerase/dehydratase family protein